MDENNPPPPNTTPFSPFSSFDGFGDELPQPLESLHETPVPPFLSKTYDLVDDCVLDGVISWGARGDSFVVWDPLEFARMILPRSFKHNNFSSFVRQLNTYGFRKIDTDKWEFANEGFIRGQRHLLKTIQRRRSTQSHQIGSSFRPSDDSNKAALEAEVERLRKERSMMMREVVDLQHQQRGTVQHMEIVNEKLRTAEKRQKQMVSFLGKIFQSPAFLARLQHKREQKSIASPRTMRKFVKHQLHETGTSGSSPKGEILKYPLLDLGENPILDTENVPFQVEDIPQDEFVTMHGFLNSLETINPLLSGKGVVGPQAQSTPDYFISYPEDLGKEKNFPELKISESESMGVEEGIWSMGFDTGIDMSMLSRNISNYDMQEFGGLSDIWDIGSLPLAGTSGIEKWTDEDEFENN